MQLAYLYIHEYKGIKHLACPFTSKYNFRTTVNSTNPNEIRLSIEFNKDHISDYFSDSNISEITAIIGQNGAGKSSILRWIRKSLDDHNTGFWESVILVFETSHGEVIVETEASLRLILNIDKTIKVQKYNVGYRPGLYDIQSQGRTLSQFHEHSSIIYYANTIDYSMPNKLLRTHYDIADEYTIDSFKLDISTSYMLQHSTRSINRESELKLDSFLLSEQRRSVLFGLGQSEFKPPFETPLTYALELNLPSSPPGLFSVELNAIYARIEQISETNYRFLFKLDFTLFTQLLSYFTNPQLPTEFQNHVNKSIKAFMALIETSDFESTSHIRELAVAPTDSQFNHFFDRKGAIKYYLEEVRPVMLAFFVKAHNEFDNDFSIYLRPGIFSSEELSNILNILSIENATIPYFNYYWRGLSSGEQSLLSLFSRLYEIRGRVFTNHILFLIDEGDVFFHPEWQRQFLSNITSFMSGLFPSKRIQYIFSSNTPFIAGDLPKSKIIHLRKNSSGVTEVATDNIQETFASNIHTLLSSNFYLSSFLGEFAKTKIEDVINELSAKGKNLPEERRRNIKKLIQQVGEKVIQERLKQIYETSTGERFATELENEAEIEALRKRIDQYDAMKKRLNEQRSDDDQD